VGNGAFDHLPIEHMFQIDTLRLGGKTCFP